MSLELAVIGLAALVTSASLTALVRGLALSHGVIDVPNKRSSHRTPTPRGGGVSIVVASTAALAVLAWIGALGSELLLAIVGGGIAVAVIGLLDDRQRVSAGVRFTVHLAAAAWALAWLGGLGPLRFGDHVVSLGWSSYLLGALGIVWGVNLFNFMDGIDGIAASEATFIAWSGALLAAMTSGLAGVAAAGVVFGATCLGFLGWNWPPARIFMGDVGSGYLGYVIAVLTLAATRNDPVALWVWLILSGVFMVDATVTLLRRLLRGERVHQAHRSHAYQWFARRWGHSKVTCSVLIVNVLWLFPWAVLAARLPRHGYLCALVALAPLVALAIAVSGRREATD